MKRKIAISFSLSLLMISPLLLAVAGEAVLDSVKISAVAKAASDTDLASISPQPDAANKPLPDRLIVRFRPEIAAALYPALHAAPNSNPKLNSTLVGNRLVPAVLITKIPELADLFKQYGVRAADAIDPLAGAYLLRTEVGTNVTALNEALKTSQAVVYTEFDYPVRAFTQPDDPIYRSGKQWGLTQIDAEDAWDIMTGTAKITIAIVDSGVGSHPELDGRILNGFNFASDPASLDTNDDYGHGTYVAGIAAAKGDNNVGIAGMDWNALVLPVKVLNKDGVGSNATIAMGIRYAADQGAQVINLSLGGTNRSQVVQDAVTYAANPVNIRTSRADSASDRIKAASGAVLIAAAGNKSQSDNLNNDPNAPSKPNYPAAYDEVIAVGATDGQDAPAAFSTYGPELSLCAPGYSIISLDWNTKDNTPAYSYGSGTSSAAPFVAGTVGLMLSLNPKLSDSQVRNILEGTADYKAVTPASSTAAPTDTPGINPDNASKALSIPTPASRTSFDGRVYNEHIGWGRLNAYKAVLAVASGQDFPNRRARVDGSIVGIAQNGQPGIDPGSVVVSLTPGDQRIPAADGTFNFSNLPPGTYTLQATSAKYGITPAPITFTIDGAENETKEFDFNFSEVSNLLFKNHPVGAFAPVSPDASRLYHEDYAYFANTQHSVSGVFKKFWDNNGGLPIFGLPISEEFVENGRTVQYFERAVFEYHTEYAGTKDEVKLSLLGNQLSVGRVQEAPFKAIAALPDSNTRQFFSQTDHSMTNKDFLNYWNTNNGELVFGYPISEAFVEKTTTNQTYIVQYFERAEMEWHPTLGNAPAHLELALLGLTSAQAQGLLPK